MNPHLFLASALLTLPPIGFAQALPPRAPSRAQLLTEIAEVVDQATHRGADRACKTRVQEPKCDFTYISQCEVIRGEAAAPYVYEVVLPLGELDPKTIRPAKGVANFPDHHGVEIGAKGLDIAITVQGQPTRKLDRVKLPLGKGEASRANALRLVRLLKLARERCADLSAAQPARAPDAGAPPRR